MIFNKCVGYNSVSRTCAVGHSASADCNFPQVKLKEEKPQSKASMPGAGTYGPPSKIIGSATPLANCSNCMARLVVLYFMNLPPCNFLH